MFSKKIWIPILIILLAGIGCGLLYRQKRIEQVPVKVYKPVEIQQIVKEALYRQRVRRYLKDREVWNQKFQQAHTERMQAGQAVVSFIPSLSQNRSAEEIAAYLDSLSGPEKEELFSEYDALVAKSEAAIRKLDAIQREKPVFPASDTPHAERQAAVFLKDVSTKYPLLETSEAVNEFLMTATSDEIYARARDMYIARHYKKHPDCAEHEAILADSRRFATYFLADREYMGKSQELSNQWEAVRLELDTFYNRIINMSEAEGLQFIENMSDSEKQVFKDLDGRRQAAYERLKAFRSQKPVSPEPSHTH